MKTGKKCPEKVTLKKGLLNFIGPLFRKPDHIFMKLDHIFGKLCHTFEKPGHIFSRPVVTLF